MIYEIVISGGPCSGKTQAKQFFIEQLRAWGYRVLYIDEEATSLFDPGIPDIAQVLEHHPEVFFEIEREILRGYRDRRRQRRRVAELFERLNPDQPVVILVERGEAEGRYYAGPSQFEQLMKEEGLTWCDVRDSYHGVIFLVTAADGAEEHYTQANNSARYESTLAAAREANNQTLAAWIGHPHLFIIDNSTDFDGKKQRALQALTRVIGVPVPLEIEHKFLLPSPPDLDNELFRDMQRIEIEQIYLRPDPEGVERRIRRRSQDGSHIYYYTEKADVRPGVRQEREHQTTLENYNFLATLRDPETKVVRKLRHCFVYQGQYFELDKFVDPRPGLWLLELELSHEAQSIDLPPLFAGAVDVTDQPEYKSASIARSC